MTKTTQDYQIQTELEKMQLPGALAVKLALQDANGQNFKRIYLMGCGRSGTWLLTGIMSTLADVALVADELEVGYFGVMATDRKALVIKRAHRAFELVEEIPDVITIVHIVRHPFDVLTSLHPVTRIGYHIKPGRWIGEMLALKYLIDTKKPNVFVVRYEDMVANPDKIQAQLASNLSIEISVLASDFAKSFAAPPKAIAAMHGLRKIDTRSVNRWKSDPKYREYLKTIQPRLGETLKWMAKEFDFDISL